MDFIGSTPLTPAYTSIRNPFQHALTRPFLPETHTVIILWGINCFEPAILHGLYESQWEPESWRIGIETVCSGKRSWVTMDTMSPDASIALGMVFICKLTIKPRTTELHCHWALQQNAAGQINSHWRSECFKWPEAVSLKLDMGSHEINVTLFNKRKRKQTKICNGFFFNVQHALGIWRSEQKMSPNSQSIQV